MIKLEPITMPAQKSNSASSQSTDPIPTSNKKSLILKTVLMTLFCLIIAAGLIFLGFWYGQRQVAPPPSPDAIKNPLSTEVPFGDEDLDTDLEYQQQMQQLTDQGAQDKTASWSTYSNTTYGFAFKYPPPVYLKETSGENYAHLYLSQNEIYIPEVYGGLLTPVEIHIQEGATVAEKVTEAQSNFYPDTLISESLPPSLQGTRIKGIMQGMYEGETLQEVFIKISKGVLTITYFSPQDFPLPLFEDILKTFRVF